MQIALDKAVEGFISYMADQVAGIPKMADRFLGFGALGALKSNPSGLIAKIKPWMEMAGIVTDDMVDIDMLKAALAEAFENVPKVSYFGFTFGIEDAAALLKKMQGLEVAQ